MIILELGIEINLKMVERSDKQPKTADIVMSSISNMWVSDNNYPEVQKVNQLFYSFNISLDDTYYNINKCLHIL